MKLRLVGSANKMNKKIVDDRKLEVMEELWRKPSVFLKLESNSAFKAASVCTRNAMNENANSTQHGRNQQRRTENVQESLDQVKYLRNMMCSGVPCVSRSTTTTMTFFSELTRFLAIRHSLKLLFTYRIGKVSVFQLVVCRRQFRCTRTWLYSYIVIVSSFVVLFPSENFHCSSLCHFFQ